MSLWQRSQACESMKNDDLIVWPSGVRTELGKNGPAWPRPSTCMACGGIAGFVIRYAFFHRFTRV